MCILGKRFNQNYMLARELGRGTFSVVKLGVNLVRQIQTYFLHVRNFLIAYFYFY
jgi:hypothetical protein